MKPVHYYKSDIYGPNILSEKFAAIIVEKDLKHTVTNVYHADEITDLWKKADYTYVDGDKRPTKHGLFIRNWGSGFTAAYIWQFPQGGVTIHVASTTVEGMEDMLVEYRLLIPKAEKDTVENRIPINFWYLAPQGPVQTIRKLYVPDWEDIKENYSASTRESLEQLMNNDFRPTSGGQFILWLGEPGTGKTTALRALGKRWKDWCDIQFITDPDRFFGSGADYMMKFLMQASETNEVNRYIQNAEPNEWNLDEFENLVEDAADENEDDRWMLLVFEDTGELLTKTAKAETGQGLSRFLNVVDGLIGQGLKIVVLVTTNEDYDSFNAAVIRPGRCRAKIDFKTLTKTEAQAWAEKHSLPVPDKEQNLADLYAIKNEQIKNEETQKQTLGFGS